MYCHLELNCRYFLICPLYLASIVLSDLFLFVASDYPLISLNISSHFYPIINMLSVMTNMLKNRVRVMVLNTTFNNISVISWRRVLLVEETGVPGEIHRPVASH